MSKRQDSRIVQAFAIELADSIHLKSLFSRRPGTAVAKAISRANPLSKDGIDIGLISMSIGQKRRDSCHDKICTSTSKLNRDNGSSDSGQLQKVDHRASINGNCTVGNFDSSREVIEFLDELRAPQHR